MPASVNRKYIPEVDQIRALAALLVFFYHCLQLIGAQIAYGNSFNPNLHWIFTYNPLLFSIEEGHTGVGLFIVLSGFTLSLGVIGKKLDYVKFLKARFFRIYPMLILCLVISLGIKQSSISDIFSSILLLSSGGVRSNLTSMFWAVGVEFQCYLVFPLLILFSKDEGVKFLIKIMLVFIVMRTLAIFSEDANPRDLSYWNFAGRIDQFCIGMILARYYHQRVITNYGLSWLLASIFLILVALFAFNQFGGWPSTARWKIVWPIIEGAIWAQFILTWLSAAKSLPKIITLLLCRFGEISYSFYLLHFSVIFIIIRNNIYLHLIQNAYYDALITAFLVVLPITTIISILTYQTIEAPFLKLRPKYIIYEDK